MYGQMYEVLCREEWEETVEETCRNDVQCWSCQGEVPHVLWRVHLGRLLHCWCFHTIRSKRSDSMAKCVVPLRVLFSCDVVSFVWLAIWSYHHLRRHSHVLPHPQAVEWQWCKRRKWDKWQGHLNSLECSQLAAV